jgi:hypothetical protein
MDKILFQSTEFYVVFIYFRDDFLVLLSFY